MNVFVLAILFYLLYRFIGVLIIPVFRTTRHMRQQFNDMNGKEKGPAAPGANSAEQAAKPKSGSSTVGEYIDFEEVK